jgi:threonine dehydratase
MSIDLEALRSARARIQPYITLTPLRSWEYLRRTLKHEAPVFLKLDTLQNTGSFKVRGAANKILRLIENGQKPTRIVAASAGNHAQAVAFVAGRLGIPATIVMPEGAPLVKAAATADYGAEVVLHGLIYDDAFAKAQEILKATPGAAYVHAYEDDDVIAGQGTQGLEIHDQLNEAGHPGPVQAVIPIGGGGLVGGVSTALLALRPGTKVYGVVSEAAPAMSESFKAGEIRPSKGRTRTLAEGLAVKKVSALTFEYVKRNCTAVEAVSDDEVADAITVLMERGKLIAEGSGAAGVAALIAGKFKLDPKVPLVISLCGGNIDMNAVSNILERGFTKNGRWLRLGLQVEDKPGELAQLTGKIGALRGNILEVTHDRTGPNCPLGYTNIRFLVETRGAPHARQIVESLEASSYRVERSPS